MRDKRLAIIVSCILLLLCISITGCNQTAEPDVTAEPESFGSETFVEPEPTATPEPEIGEMEDPVSEPEEYELNEDELEPQIDQEPEVYLNLDGMSILAMAPFEDGVGWVQYMSDGEMFTAAVETDGHLLFKIPGPVWYVSPFEMGAAYVVISDNATYYSNAAGGYEQVASAVTHEEIYDLDGNLWYSTAWSSYDEEHILCSKDDKFVVLRHESGLDHNDWTLGTIDRFGDTVDEFRSYDGVGGGLLPSWKSKYSGTKMLPNKYGAGYGNGNDGDPGDGFSRYIGDGAFYLTGGSLLYQPEKQTVGALKGTTLVSDVFDGKVLSYWNGTYYVQDINSSDANSVQALRDNQYTDIKARGFSDGFRHMMVENLLYHDHAYYDIDMNRAVEITDYTNLEMDGSIFHDGYALIALKGMDGKGYVTVIDKNGTVQFEPIQAKKASQRVSDGYFVVRTDTECAVYDIYGNYIRYLCSASDAEYIYDISGGHVTVNGFGATKIFTLNPEE